jgi:deoxyribodipyrimidine photolyase-related protein
MRMVLSHGYAHHIHRLMVFGNLALIAGVHPYAFHRWHMAMYCDAVDWVSLPNTLGMSQFGDGGIIATKPYCASGAYINRMSDFCNPCRYDPKRAEGAEACPVTTLYWDFLDRHAARLRKNPRMVMQYRNLDRKTPSERKAIRKRAQATLTRLFA